MPVTIKKITKNKAKLKLNSKVIKPYLFISPFFIIYAIFGLYPFLSGVWLSLQSRSGFVGLKNYQKVLTSDRFWKSISNAFLYMTGSVFIILPVALFTALMLSSKHIGKNPMQFPPFFLYPTLRLL